MSHGIQLNDTGTQFLITIVDIYDVAIDVSGATEQYIIFKKPGGEVTINSSSFYTDGVDGKIYYTVVDGDLNEIGTWKIQAHVIASNGSWKSEFKPFKVYRNL